MYIRVILLYIIVAGNLLAQEKNISLSFSDIPQMLEISSPQLKIVNAMNNLTTAKSDASLQWSNPEINYGREQVSNADLKETEQLFFLSKTFMLPWNYLNEKDVWKAELAAAGCNTVL